MGAVVVHNLYSPLISLTDCTLLTRIVLAVIFLHDALVAEAQVHFGSVRSTNRVVIIRALGFAFASWRNRCRCAGRL